jgi:site-specific DNA-methyltransferase (adenine-specific)
MDNHDRQILFSKKSDEWTTPQWLFDKLNTNYNFTLDAAATQTTSKCSKFYTIEDDGLSQEWTDEVVFCNPPYSKCFEWIKKGYEEVKAGRAQKVIMLVPARVDTKWFHSFCIDSNYVSEICFFKGRLKFGNQKNSAPFPSMFVVFEKNNTQTKFLTMLNK